MRDFRQVGVLSNRPNSLYTYPEYSVYCHVISSPYFCLYTLPLLPFSPLYSVLLPFEDHHSKSNNDGH